MCSEGRSQGKCSYKTIFFNVLQLARGDGWLPNIVSVPITTESHTLKEFVFKLCAFHLDLKEKEAGHSLQAGAQVPHLPPSSLSAQAR